MSLKKFPLCIIIRNLLIVICLILLGVYSMMNSDSKNGFRIATGSESGAYYKYGKIYQEILKDDNIALDINTTAGSEDALNLLLEGKVDLAFIQGGTAGDNQKLKNSEHIKSIASVFYEPLWVFHNPKLEVANLYDLKGKTISVGPKGSGTRILSLQLLKDNNIDESNTKILYLHSDEGHKRLKNGEIDALFISVSPSSNILKRLINSECTLMSFKRDIAYKDRYEYVTSLVLGEGVIDLARNIPEADKRLLATTANLVVNTNSVSPEKVRLILKRIKQVHKHGGIFEKVDFFPSKEFVEFDLHPTSEIYFENGDTFLEQYLPYWLTSFIYNSMIIILPLIPILIIVFKFILPVYTRNAIEYIYVQKDRIRQVDSKIGKTDSKRLLKQVANIRRLLSYRCDIYYLFQSNYYDLKLTLNGVEDRIIQSDKEEENAIEEDKVE